MKLCDTCVYRDNTEYFKPCIIYRDDCELYEKKRDDMKAIIQIDVPNYQIGQEVSIYFKDTMMIKGIVQELGDDLISRDAVNTLVDELARAISDERCCMPRGRSTATIMQDILNLPSVNPYEPKTIQEKQAESEKYDKAFEDGYENGYAQAIANGTPLDEKELKLKRWIEKDIETLNFIIESGWLISDYDECTAISACEDAITALKQYPVLDKIRAEIENDWQLKKYPSSPFSCGLRQAIEIIDKYKAESEIQE